MSLIELIPHLPQTMLRKTLGIAKSIQADGRRTRVLIALAPYLPKSLLRRALKFAQTIQEENKQVKALAALVPYLPESLLRKTLKIAYEIRQKDTRLEALAILVPHLPEAIAFEVLTISKIHLEWHKAQVLMKIIPYLSSLQLQEALTIALKLQRNSLRAEVLTTMASYLPDTLKEKALRESLVAVMAIEKESSMATEKELDRTKTLGLTSSKLIELPYFTLLPLWQELLDNIIHRTRQDLLLDLPPLIQIIRKLGGDDALIELFHAIQDVGRWWP